jgi:hypothetical protein
MSIQELYETILHFDQGVTLFSAPSKPHSYRGYYERLAFEPSIVNSTIGEFRTMLIDCIGKTFTGYKGGKFTMCKDTIVHLAHCGSTGGEIIGLVAKADGVHVLTEENE